jgi:hypothetical protein
VRTVLKAKSAYSDEDVTRVWQNIEDYVTADEAADAVDQAARETLHVLDNRPDTAVYGWSGGKDSIALQVVMQAAGVRRALMGYIPALEFRTFLAWCHAHQPDGLAHVPNTDIDLHWLSNPTNDRYLFPTTSTDGYKWTLLGTRRAQRLYQQDHHPRMQIYGRRTMDGNAMPGTPYGIHVTKELTTYCPIRNWSHEMVLAVIHYNQLSMPPVYGWPQGWRTGTGPWPGRRLGTRDRSWHDTWAVEPDRVREAAEVIPDAADWLARTGRN